jgi:Leucine-rich repeat (LRR) protein
VDHTEEDVLEIIQKQLQGDQLLGELQWACPACTFLNHDMMGMCEMCETLRPSSRTSAKNHEHSPAMGNTSFITSLSGSTTSEGAGGWTFSSRPSFLTPDSTEEELVALQAGDHSPAEGIRGVGSAQMVDFGYKKTLTVGEEIEKRVEICRRKDCKFLSLESLDLRVLPSQLFTEVGPTQASPMMLPEFQGLTVLYLSNNGLTFLPPELESLKCLTQLHLQNNKIEFLPGWIGELTALDKLCLSHNCLTQLPPEIGRLSALTVLSLFNNYLTSLPSEIGRLHSLQSLFLNDNRLLSVPWQIGNLFSLSVLHLNNNRLTCLPHQIGRLKKLKKLYLDNNQLITLPASILSIPNVHVFSIKRNLFSYAEEGTWDNGVMSLLHLAATATVRYVKDYDRANITQELKNLLREGRNNCSSCNALFFGEGRIVKVFRTTVHHYSIIRTSTALPRGNGHGPASPPSSPNNTLLVRGAYCSLKCSHARPPSPSPSPSPTSPPVPTSPSTASHTNSLNSNSNNSTHSNSNDAPTMLSYSVVAPPLSSMYLSRLLPTPTNLRAPPSTSSHLPHTDSTPSLDTPLSPHDDYHQNHDIDPSLP